MALSKDKERGEPRAKKARVSSVEVIEVGNEAEAGSSSPRKTRALPKRAGKEKAKIGGEEDRKVWEGSVREWEARVRVANDHLEHARSRLRELEE